MGKPAIASRGRRREIGVEIAGLWLLAFVTFGFISVLSEQRVASGAMPENACGPAGRILSSVLFHYFGVFCTYFLLLLAGTIGVCIFFRIRISHWRTRLGAALLLLVPAVSILEWGFSIEPRLGPPYDAHGGFVGEALGLLLDQVFQKWGTRVVLGLLFLVGFLLVTDLLISPLTARLLRKAGAAGMFLLRGAPAVARRIRLGERLSTAGGAIANAFTPPAAPAPAATASRSPAARPAPPPPAREGATVPEREPDEEEEDDDELEDSAEEEMEEFGEDLEDWVDEEGEEDDDEGKIGADDDEPRAEESEAEESKAAEPPAAEGGAKQPRNIQVTHRDRNGAPVESQDDAGLDLSEKQLTFTGVYSLPALGFLDDAPPPAPGAGREELEEVAIKIEQTLSSFKVDARVENVLRGPVITQYEVSLAAGIKVHKIVSLSDDLAMALSAQSVRVVAPIPGKSAVGIEVPNRTREIVVAKELLCSREYRDRKLAIPLLLGKDAAGTPIVEDLARMPHLLIAGSTGSGKSVCINSIIVSILMTRTPDELKLILVDPKMVELSAFEEIPHLMTPVITDMKKAPAALDWLCRTMDDRYTLLSNAEVRNIAGYNELGKDEVFARIAKRTTHEEAEAAPAKLPYIVIIIDELADLMLTASKEVENSIIRLSQKSRAVGLHVVVATQRPSVDVITGLIKANLPCRVSFQVAGRVDSRTIIDRNGAEKLLGQGDMLLLPPGTSNLVRAQGTYISDREIRKICRFLKREKAPEFSREIETYLEAGSEGEEEEAIDDDLYDQAVRIILESQRGSVSLLQRRLGIGYTRASRLMDIMGDQGLVGAFKGSKAREVYMTLEDWEARKSEQG